jgi:hypothetical protein
MRMRPLATGRDTRHACRPSPERSAAILAALQRRCLIAGRKAGAQGLTVKAARLYRRAFQLGILVYGPEHPLVLLSLKQCTAALRAAHRETEAVALEQQTRATHADRGSRSIGR